MTPIQPRLAESNLFLVSAAGPGALSFNEFNPLFNRNGLTFQSSGLAGENSTYAGEGVLSGIYKNLSFSVGGFHYQTNGFHRPGFTLNGSNTEQRDAIGDAFIQAELSPQTSIQAEYRYRNLEKGDLRLRFFEDEFFPGLTSKEERSTIRLGGRHSFSPDSILLGSFAYQHADTSDRTDRLAAPVNFLDIKTPARSLSGEVQHLFRSRYINLVSGVGHFNVDARLKTILDLQSLIIPIPFPPFVIVVPAQRITTDDGNDARHTNLYLYSYIKPWNNLTFTLGVTGDFLSTDRELTDRNQANPKVGVTWNPFPDTTVRAAALRTLKRTLITNQTLEPTQVAGFNQFYDDFNGTRTWRYGGAIDQKFTKELFGGVEFSKRDLKVPFLDATTDPENPTGRIESQNEKLSRTYLFWTPHPWVALRTEYVFERIISQGITDQPRNVDTHRVPLGLSFFHPSGFSAFLKTTFVNQNGKFVLSDTTVRPGHDRFWLLDAAINYRLPQRYGFITVGASNITNQKFKFFDRDFRNPSITPDRMVFGRITLALP
jgi:hypothetical protein